MTRVIEILSVPFIFFLTEIRAPAATLLVRLTFPFPVGFIPDRLRVA